MMNLKEKIVKLSEDALYDMLDKLYDEGKEGTEQYKVIDSEIDRRVEIQRKAEELKKQKAKEAEEERQRLIERFEEITEKNGKRCTMKAMALEFGDDYGYWDDYHIDNNYTMYSMCDVKDDEKKEVEHESMDDALKTVQTRVYYRVYHVLFRNGPTAETLDRLLARIVKIKEEESK